MNKNSCSRLGKWKRALGSVSGSNGVHRHEAAASWGSMAVGLRGRWEPGAPGRGQGVTQPWFPAAAAVGGSTAGPGMALRALGLPQVSSQTAG